MKQKNLNGLAKEILIMFQENGIHPFDAIVLLQLLQKNILEICTDKDTFKRSDTMKGYL